LAEALDRTSGRPLYLQIVDQLAAAIKREEYRAGELLPSERRLRESYDVARGTVRQAIAELNRQGLVDVRHGTGVFVREGPPLRRKAFDRFARAHREAGKAAYLAELDGSGLTPAVEVLKVGPQAPPAGIAEQLDLDPGERVLVRSRRYLASGRPMEVATSYVPWRLAEGTAIARKNTGPGGIYARLEEMGHRLDHFSEDVRVRMPTPEERASLELQPGVPVFDLVRVAYTVAGRPVELCQTVMAGDRWLLSYELPAR
jgi:GntR family transcriptional regulator